MVYLKQTKTEKEQLYYKVLILGILLSWHLDVWQNTLTIGVCKISAVIDFIV